MLIFLFINIFGQIQNFNTFLLQEQQRIISHTSFQLKMQYSKSNKKI